MVEKGRKDIKKVEERTQKEMEVWRLTLQEEFETKLRQ
jgi:hypothetical protein